MIPFSQNDQQALPVMKARVRQESSQRKVFYFSMFQVFNYEDREVYHALSCIYENINMLFIKEVIKMH